MMFDVVVLTRSYKNNITVYGISMDNETMNHEMTRLDAALPGYQHAVKIHR